ncbi:hypothetical protein Dda_5191 [Drechslerella dactyloides]|uniref:Fungal N-terminal domain-containing protein n=1 Tax=Drechslerella dactyloides TaxID=74499 RepID=A0AAD6NIG6_DREDA|nr:hypothetical protein Dda_5191 [Drechslerella dactyloides]
MDPLSIAASVAGLLSLCIQVGQTVSTLAEALANVDNTISSFRGEIDGLAGVLAAISASFSDPTRHRILEAASNGTGHIGQYWKGVTVALTHCHATLRKMGTVLDGVQTSRRTRIFRSFGKHLKLSSEEGVLTLYRQEVQSHTANLQISLQMISVCMSLAADDMNVDAAVRLDDLSDDVRNIRQLLETTKGGLPNPKPGDVVAMTLVSSSQSVVDDLQGCLGAAELLISDASTLAEMQSVRESTGTFRKLVHEARSVINPNPRLPFAKRMQERRPPATDRDSMRESLLAVPHYFTEDRRNRVQDWIDAPTADTISDSSSDVATNRTPPTDGGKSASTQATSPLADRSRPSLAWGLHPHKEDVREDDEVDDDANSVSSDIDSGFKSNLYSSGLQYFKQGDYVHAERFFTKALQANEADNSKSTDPALLKVKFYLAQTLSKQRLWDDALALLIALQSLVPQTDDPLKWLEASIMHELAVVYLGKGFSADAKRHAKSAASQRKKLHGKNDSRFFASIGLLADICESQGDPVTAEGYRGFLPARAAHWYTHLHTPIPIVNVDDKEAVFPDVPSDDGRNEFSPAHIHPLSSGSSQPSSVPPSRSTSFTSRAPTTPATQLSDPQTPIRHAHTYPYTDPHPGTVELPANPYTDPQSPTTPTGPGHISPPAEKTSPQLKEFLETFRQVGQYQMLGWKDKAARAALTYYRTFADSGRYRLVSRYMDDIAWRALERNIVEGLSSLSSTGHGFSAIHFFALLGVQPVVALLLDRKADVCAKAAGIFGYTQASGERKRGGKLSGLARSLSRNSISSVAGFAAEWTPLHFAAAYSGDPDTIKLLLDRGAAVEQRAGKGWTPLLLATRKAALDMERYLNHSTDLQAVEALVEGGARVDAVDDDGLGVQAHAHCMKTEEELASYLLGLSLGV